MKIGVMDGGCYNVMGGGCLVVVLCLLICYLYVNSGMILKADYEALFMLIWGFLMILIVEKVNVFS